VFGEIGAQQVAALASARLAQLVAVEPIREGSAAFRHLDLNQTPRGRSLGAGRPELRRLYALAPGLTPRSVLEKFSAIQMIDVHIPTTDGRELLLTRYTQPEPELNLLLEKLKLTLPGQPPPKITAAEPGSPSPV
jgi:hypothetical protein